MIKIFILFLLSHLAIEWPLGIAGFGLTHSTRVDPSATISVQVTAPQQRFIVVDGADFAARQEAALKLGRGAASSRFWTAYSFDVRPGVAVDAEVVSSDGSRTFIQGATVSLGSPAETRNLGLFLLNDSKSNSVTRAEIYNLERQREYSGYPVYWLGRASNEESLRLLNDLIESNKQPRVAEHSVMAVGIHDDPRTGSMLENIVRRSTVEEVRATAVFWLGHVGGSETFLAGLVRNEQESIRVRKKAAFALGVNKGKEVLPTIENLYGSITHREVRKQLIFAASINESESSAINFLIKVAQSDADRELKKQAIFWLGQKAGQRSLEALGNTLENDPDTEVQKQAVFAISRRSRDEAVPLLIRIARTHAKAEVRRQAMFWLGQSGDPRAVEFFKEILLK